MFELESDEGTVGALGPQVVDQKIREAIGLCWFMIPEKSRSWDRVEQEINRIVKRAFDNYRDDLNELHKIVSS